MFQIVQGIRPDHLDQAAVLYWEAFGTKLGTVMGPADKGIAYIRRVINKDYGITAIAPDGALLGVAGFKTYHGALVGGGFRDMAAVYGPLSTLWRAGLIALMTRDVENRRFLMDGIFVAPAARGQGIGTALLQAIMAEAATRGYDSVRLDVINTNERARALYERQGFKPLATTGTGLLRHIFHFDSATAMVRAVDPASQAHLP